MHLIHPDSTLVPLLYRLLDSDIHLWIFTVNVTVDEATVIGDLVAGDIGGLALDASDFPLNGVVAHRGTILGSPVAVNNTSGASATGHGYFYTDAANSVLLGAANFDAPQVVANGDDFLVTPILGGSSLFS